MRSMKLLVATAIVAALVAGPVLAQDAGGTMSPTAPAAGTTKPVKHHTGKKHKHTSKSSTSSTPSTTPAQ